MDDPGVPPTDEPWSDHGPELSWVSVALCVARLRVPATDHSGALINSPSGLDRSDAGDRVARDADARQLDAHEGPGVDVSAGGATSLVSTDLRDDPRWPTWGPRVARELGLRSVLAVARVGPDGRRAALTLYAGEPAAFAVEDVGHVEAALADLDGALATPDGLGPLGTRARDRSLQGKAVGMVMRRFAVGPGPALHHLHQVARARGTSLADVVSSVVHAEPLPPPGQV